MAPITIANGVRMIQKIQQQQHELIYFANAQGATMMPMAEVKATPRASMTTNPTIIRGTSRQSPINARTAIVFGMVSVSAKKSLFSRPSTH